jgi:hypothetical protein
MHAIVCLRRVSAVISFHVLTSTVTYRSPSCCGGNLKSSCMNVAQQGKERDEVVDEMVHDD